MLITILAVTKAWDKFCIAGMDDNGRWIRPIPRIGTQRFWKREELIRNNEFIKCGDIWEINGFTPQNFQYSNHTEDLVVSDFNYVRTLDNGQFIRFLDSKTEDRQDFLDTVNARGRSTCLVRVNRVINTTTTWNGKIKPRMRFEGDFNLDNPHTNNRDYIVKDCKWVGLMLDGYRGLSRLQRIYLCIGLATPYRGVEHPQVIGLHTSPEVIFSENYPD